MFLEIFNRYGKVLKYGCMPYKRNRFLIDAEIYEKYKGKMYKYISYLKKNKEDCLVGLYYKTQKSVQYIPCYVNKSNFEKVKEFIESRKTS